MPCNWELYELRVIVFTMAVEGGSRGIAGQGPKFYVISPDLASLGIRGFQGTNESCDFASVFDQLISRKALLFACPQRDNNQTSFGVVETAKRLNQRLPAAKLYVHRRDQSDGDSVSRGPGLVLRGVTVNTASSNGGRYYIHLSGDEARRINY